ncbi:MAG: cob(I)yrinic acid a,c-diamide adenosyltransferase [Candidatus Vogelbacteria bacterium]|nr:cob(I)yrinic acid a,c-diamide adenosyltransferase [Candidatus Vogelbacteria bacterium]
MLYTRKGDGGTTKTFGCDQKIAKSSAVAEALGSLDEINSLLGVCKIKAPADLAVIVGRAQQDLFIVQAELAAADKHLGEAKVKEVEKIIDEIERELPPITTFFVSGGTELAASFDHARTVARRAERRAVAAREAGAELGDITMGYLNRLSSLLYALARLANHRAGVAEEPPTYE